ncbi:MAG: uroporphyrinogen-III synthase [Gammaproteobacteria bacterium]|jgi:uroporphyrinogen-III synthase
MNTDDGVSFTGRCVALPEARQLDVLAGLLERRGAKVIRCPLVSILDTPDQDHVHEWLQRFVGDDQLQDFILLTGEGLKRLLAASERMRMREPFVKKLARVRKISRGPKPGRVLRELGLQSDVVSVQPTSAGVIETLAELEFATPYVGLQLYGSEPNLPLQNALRERDLQPVPVAPYIYTTALEDDYVMALIEKLADGDVDAIAFTSQPQVRRLFSVAESNGQTERLRKAFKKILVAAIGPVVGEYLKSYGVRVDVIPQTRFFMRPLVDALANRFGSTPQAAL